MAINVHDRFQQFQVFLDCRDHWICHPPCVDFWFRPKLVDGGQRCWYRMTPVRETGVIQAGYPADMIARRQRLG